MTLTLSFETAYHMMGNYRYKALSSLKGKPVLQDTAFTRGIYSGLSLLTQSKERQNKKDQSSINDIFKKIANKCYK